ncbi:heparinase II/III domain-containing protein [Metabacillus schmidteae]|uniref:heparinase II/III domain-containing protein n=1 Tax=Metabacillus schmidteae TaxID=2730405 RepID=UPI00158B466B|nr:heparinase II/III family protein [Metabacillus schmidteae]
MIGSLITEYGLPWVFNRTLYSAKLKMMRAIPSSENLFEKDVQVKRIEILDIIVEPIEEFLKRLSNEKQVEIVSIANKAIEGKILGFSSIELDYGNPINWHYSPITKKIVEKSLKWYQIPDFDPERGDIKAVWEASRFTHFFYFSRAYMITKDRRYYEAFSNQMNDWIRENPYPFGSHYKCGQEATLRMINTLITYSVFKHFRLITSKDEENVKMIVEGSYKKVLSNFFYAHKCIKNNHTLSEITGLIIGAWACGDNKNMKKAYTLLDKEIHKQFLPDGGYRQYSFNYQRFALQLMELNIKLSEQTMQHLSNQSKELIKGSANLLYQMQDETGDVPNYGSNDGALIFPVTSCGYRDFRPVVNTLFAFIDGNRVFEHGDYDEEILWFSDKNVNDIPMKKTPRVSSSFHKSGFYSLRNEYGFLMTVLQDYDTRPAQMDQLHIDLWHRGINVFCDSGTYSYATDIGKKMALTSAHNTAVIQGKEQMKKHGPFLIYDWTMRGKVEHNDDSFIGTMNSKNDYSHTRRIKKNDLGYSITDSVVGDGEVCEFYFHTPCDVIKVKDGFELYKNNKPICSVRTVGDIEVKKAYRSLYYLKKEEINCVVVRTNMIEKNCSMELLIELKDTN